MAELLTREDVAKMLRIDPDAVDKLRRKGDLPCVLVSARRIRYDPDAIRAFILRRTPPTVVMTDPGPVA